jgi:CheY-like chemotaxis protein
MTDAKKTEATQASVAPPAVSTAPAVAAAPPAQVGSPSPSAQPAVVAPAEPAKPSNGKYILVAEDDRFYAHIYQAKLMIEGFEIQVVNNGDELLKAAKEKKPNLILLDLMMPIKDGFDTLKELKADDKLKDVKVVVISNLGQDEDVQGALQAGAVDFFIKANLSIEEMVDKVKKHTA